MSSSSQLKKEFASYNALLDFLRTWTTWGEDKFVYDLGGIVFLIGACLDNLKAARVSGEAIVEYFEPKQLDYLLSLARNIEKSKEWELIKNGLGERGTEET